LNNTTLLFGFYLISIIYIAVDIFIVLKKDALDKDLIFCLFATYILNISMSLFYFYFYNLLYSLLNSLFLMVMSFLLLLDLKRVLKDSFTYFTLFFVYNLFIW